MIFTVKVAAAQMSTINRQAIDGVRPGLIGYMDLRWYTFDWYAQLGLPNTMKAPQYMYSSSDAVTGFMMIIARSGSFLPSLGTNTSSTISRFSLGARSR